ncbi:MAG: hypothetical protein GYB49_15800 [Alphaproteobacteria bacterium]|nr:hypothetical protein [Hyphomonas sp.]MBR9808679.1 hypothetical protein [Alphaproteobacteria bacterium]|tara:strand:- start:213 stop:608 length:396 start_codon:yes stop_codon:yes gene_type:complete
MPYDDTEIVAEDELIRGIPASQIKNGRVSSGAFKSSSDPYRGMSVDLASLEPEQVYPNEKHLGAVKFVASCPREKNLLVGKDPIATNHAHCNIWRHEDGEAKSISTSQARHMQKSSEWHVSIENVRIHGDS